MGGSHLMITITAPLVIVDSSREPIRDGALIIDGGLIVASGTASDLAHVEVDETLSVDGTLIPGLIDSHSHLRGVPLTAQGIAPERLERWICGLTAMTEVPAADDALLAAAALLRTGVTSVQAFAHSLAPLDDYADTVAALVAGAAEAGIRALIPIGFSDRAEYAPEPRTPASLGLPSARHGLGVSDFPALLERCRTAPLPSTIAIGVGPVAGQWATDDALAMIAGARGELRVHTHLHESALQRDWVAGEPSPYERLRRAGLLDARLSAAHGVHLTDSELEGLAEAGVTLVHCPISNERLEVGTARVRAWLDAGVTAGLGLDSQDDGVPDMFEAMRAAQVTATRLDTALGAHEVFGMATVGGAHALGDPRLGTLRAGARADIVHLDLDLEDGREIADLVERATADAVTTVWVDGECVVENGRTRTAVREARARDRVAAALDSDAPARRDRQRRVAASLAESGLFT